MMARSTNRSNQRPDTLMQDRNANRSTKPSCDARPDASRATADDDGQRWRRPHSSISGLQARLRQVPAQTTMLSQNPFAQGYARCSRGRTRCCTRPDGHAGVRQVARRAQEGRDAVCALEDPPPFRAHAPAGPFGSARRVSPRRHRAEPEDISRLSLAFGAERPGRVRCMSAPSVCNLANGWTRATSDLQKLKSGAATISSEAFSTVSTHCGRQPSNCVALRNLYSITWSARSKIDGG